MGRYEDVSQDVLDMVTEVRREWFPDLRNVKIKVLFDIKKKMSNGYMVLGRIQKTNDLLRYLTVDESLNDGFDYIMYLDRMAFRWIEDNDKIRIIRHELRHIFIDIEANNPYKIIPHDIEDFAEEIEFNSDDVRWKSRVVEVALSQYENESE